MTLRRVGVWIKRALLSCAAIWGVTFTALVAYDIFVPAPPVPDAPFDAIICLGAGMSRTTGWMEPDTASHRRAVTCAGLYHAGTAPLIVFTGYGHHISSVAAAMGRVALSENVPQDAIMLEERARSTIQNAVFSEALLPQDAQRVLIVSDNFHLPRATLLFRAFTDLETSTYAALPTVDDGTGRWGRSTARWLAREAVVIWFNVGRVAIYRLAGAIGVDRDTRIAWFN